MQSKLDRLDIRIPTALKKDASAAAARDGRTLTGLVIKLLGDYVAKEKKR